MFCFLNYFHYDDNCESDDVSDRGCNDEEDVGDEDFSLDLYFSQGP